MPRGRPVTPVVLNDDEKSQLLSLANSRSLPHGLVQRAQIVLACAQGDANSSIASRMHLNNSTVGKWRKRFDSALRACTMSCAWRRTHQDERVAEVINSTANQAPRWMERALHAQHTGVSKSTVQRWVGGNLIASARPLLHRKSARRRALP